MFSHPTLTPPIITIYNHTDNVDLNARKSFPRPDRHCITVVAKQFPSQETRLISHGTDEPPLLPPSITLSNNSTRTPISLGFSTSTTPSLLMTVATQHSTSPDHSGAPNMFARNMIKDNDFIKTFGNTATNSHTIEPRQTENYNTPRGGNFNHINLDESFFDFEPPSRADSPYQNHFLTLEASGTLWSNEPNFHPFTSPNSESFSPKSWPYNDYQQGHLSNIFTNIQPASTREHYGQVTLPDDEYNNETLLDRQLCE